MIEVPDVVRNKAHAAGAQRWLDDLSGLVDALAGEWGLTIGRVFQGATEALVLDVVQRDGVAAVLKLLVPRDGSAARHECTVLRLADGDGCVRLLDSDEERGALLLERLGPSLEELGRPFDERLAILTGVASAMWRPAPDADLPAGAEKGRWLIDSILRLWEELDRPCSERVVAHAVACAERRIAAHDDERSVLVHGDVHQWNTLSAGAGFKLIDPDGLHCEAEYDLGVMMREDPEEMLHGDPMDRAHLLASWTGRDATAIWEWGVVERVSTGLIGTQVGLPPCITMLAVAELIAP